MPAELVMNLETILVALIVSVIAPGVLALITGRQRRLEKIEDYRRQDEVAALAATSSKEAAEGVKVTQDKLEQIHVLVNSNVTELMQGQLDSVLRESALLKLVAKGRMATVEFKEAIAVAATRIKELKEKLLKRAEQTKIADKQVK